MPTVRYKGSPLLLKKACGKQMPAASACVPGTIGCKTLCTQHFTALCASASEHVAAVCGLHALAESMHLAALPFLRLISPYHIFTPLLSISLIRVAPIFFYTVIWAYLHMIITLIIIVERGFLCQAIFPKMRFSANMFGPCGINYMKLIDTDGSPHESSHLSITHNLQTKPCVFHSM